MKVLAHMLGRYSHPISSNPPFSPPKGHQTLLKSHLTLIALKTTHLTQNINRPKPTPPLSSLSLFLLTLRGVPWPTLKPMASILHTKAKGWSGVTCFSWRIEGLDVGWIGTQLLLPCWGHVLLFCYRATWLLWHYHFPSQTSLSPYGFCFVVGNVWIKRLHGSCLLWLCENYMIWCLMWLPIYCLFYFDIFFLLVWMY